MWHEPPHPDSLAPADSTANAGECGKCCVSVCFALPLSAVHLLCVAKTPSVLISTSTVVVSSLVCRLLGGVVPVLLPLSTLPPVAWQLCADCCSQLVSNLIDECL